MPKIIRSYVWTAAFIGLLLVGAGAGTGQPPGQPSGSQPPAPQLPSPSAPAVTTQPPTPAITNPPPVDQLPRPSPRQGVPSTQAVATVNMFWNQPADLLATITSYYNYVYYIDTATTGIAITPANCATGTQQGLFPCNGVMTSLVNGTHNYTVEVQCPTCADPKNVKSGPVSYTYSGSSTVQAPSSPSIESGSGTIIPPQQQIIDSKGSTWTQSSVVPASCPAGVVGHPASDCLDQQRNGSKISLGSQIYYKNRLLYVLGPDGSSNSWWQWKDAPGCPGASTDTCWTKIGATKP